MDELLSALAQGSPESDPTVLAAIITALGVLLAAGFTTIAAFWPKHHGTDDTPESLQVELLRRARDAEKECRKLRAENTALRDHLLRADIDPSTGKSFRAPP